MKRTVYVPTDFAEITPAIKRAWEIKSHARGKRLIPLAKGEKPPEEKAKAAPKAKSAPKSKKTRRKAKGKAKAGE